MTVYGAAAQLYRAAGWAGVLPLPVGRKTPPPSGYTGHRGVDPTDEQIAEWVSGCPDGNLCLRLPRGVIALDLDFYGPGEREAAARGKHAAAVAAWGALPPTWCATSRSNGSGKYLYRVPGDVALLGDAPGGEVVQNHHRYVVAWPSVNQSDSGRTVHWIGPDGRLDADGTGGPDVLGVPSPGEFPALPDTWLEGLRADRRNSERVQVAAGERELWRGRTRVGGAPLDPEYVLSGVREGERNGWMFKYACHLRFWDRDRAEAVALVGAAMAACDPPYEDEPAELLVDRVWDRYEPGADELPAYSPIDQLARKADRRIRLTWRDASVDCSGPASRLVLQHRGTGRIRSSPLTCRKWGCPSCRDQRALGVLGGMSAAIGAAGCYVRRVEGKKDAASVQRLLHRRRSEFLRVSRGTVRAYLFAEQNLGPEWRHLGTVDALLVARRALGEGVSRVGGAWVAKPLKPIYRSLGVASTLRATAALLAAEEQLREIGIDYSFDSDEDPPFHVREQLAEAVIAALSTQGVAADLCADDTLQDVLAGA